MTEVRLAQLESQVEMYGGLHKHEAREALAEVRRLRAVLKPLADMAQR